MSVARAAGVALRPVKRSTTSLVQRRAASSHAHEEHHHEEYHDTNVYPPEVFNTPFWRRAVLAGVAVAAFYKFAPAPGEDTRLAGIIRSFATPQEVWKDITFKHLILSVEGSNETLVQTDAKRPPVHRYRYPQRFEQYSPHSQPVGIHFDASDVVVKRD